MALSWTGGIGLRIRGMRALRCASLMSRHSSSIPDNELTVTAPSEACMKKKVAGGTNSIAEKLIAVVDKIHERRLPPELRRGACIGIIDPSRVEADIVNVAEQRIQRSILNGDFERLPGRGRPLKFETNPHADPAEDMAYRILAKNGFAPEWVELNKEIRFMIQRWRASLALGYQGRCNSDGSKEESKEWSALLSKLEAELKDINRKVLKYNLLVPFGRQVMSYKLEKELILLQESKKAQTTLDGS